MIAKCSAITDDTAGSGLARSIATTNLNEILLGDTYLATPETHRPLAFQPPYSERKRPAPG